MPGERGVGKRPVAYAHWAAWPCVVLPWWRVLLVNPAQKRWRRHWPKRAGAGWRFIT
jgi:hypothetical protein